MAASIGIEVLETTVELFTARPAGVTGGNWKVQYFHNSTAITTASTKVRRTVFLDPGVYFLTARWTRQGSVPVTSEITSWNLFASPGV